MKKRILRSIYIVALAATLLSSLLMFGAMYAKFYSGIMDEVKKESAFVVSAIKISGDNYLTDIPEDFTSVEDCRITLIASDGNVLYDNFADASKMENHLNRPEVRDALKNGTGESSRMSDTVGKQTFYYAVLLPDGNILRVASTTDSALSAVLSSIPWLILIIAVVIGLATIFARLWTKNIVDPINQLDLNNPLANDIYEELSPLLLRIENQNRQIKKQMKELSQKQDEFNTIAENMNEALILINKYGTVISINSSAALLFGIDKDDHLGRDIFTIDRSAAFQNLLNEALQGTRKSIVAPVGSGKYQIIANPVKNGAKIGGVVILAFDVTEHYASEQMRREFTANVSHELKTPLHSISGCAEIIKNGLVKSEDIPHFIEQIYSEAQRLIALVDDIIRLSRLDEGESELVREKIDLFECANSTSQLLRSEADKKGLALTVHGETSEIIAVPQLINEIIFNLCDNAIKYNKDNGSVDVSVGTDGRHAFLTVADTGIGIPPEHQGRIFERFYRVDKSHSKKTGGTGLGLSIVKHAVQLLNGSIELSSTPGEGTIITVTLPKV